MWDYYSPRRANGAEVAREFAVSYSVNLSKIVFFLLQILAANTLSFLCLGMEFRGSIASNVDTHSWTLRLCVIA